jgi:hypothetical protein
MRNDNLCQSVKGLDTRHHRVEEGVYAVIATCILSILTVGCELNSNSTATADVIIYPTSVTLSAVNIGVVTFAASGGNIPYTWSLSDNTLGTVYTSTNATVLYQSTTNVGINTLTVRDSSDNSAIATITQN